MKSFGLARIEVIFLIVVILIGGFLRLYRLRDTVMFLGDQGRDAIIAKNILKNNDIALIGPVTSVGNMYLGPLYYYFMVPGLALTYPDPIGPALTVAILGVLTIPLLYLITKKMFSIEAAFFTTFLFSVSAVASAQVRFSWNPNIAPIVGLLLFYCLYQAIQNKKYWNLTIAILLYAVLIQLHYMALLVGGIIAAVVIWLLVSHQKNRKQIIQKTIIGTIGFILSLVPLVIFDIRHDYINAKAFTGFINSPEEHLRNSRRILQVIMDFQGNAHKVVTQLFGSASFIMDQALLFFYIITSLLLLSNRKLRNKNSYFLLYGWLGLIIVAISLYSSSIFDHYLSFTQAVSHIFLGIILAYYFNKGVVGKIGALLLASILTVINIQSAPAFAKSNNYLESVAKTSDSIVEKVADEEKYNIVLISGTGDIDAQNYRYYLETTNKPPVQKENRDEVDILFIIQEDYFDKKVTDSPIYEIVVFPDKEPVEVYSINNGPTITILKRNYE